jgi:hypothetical protein
MIAALIVIVVVLLALWWNAESQSRSLKRIRENQHIAELARRRQEAGLPPYDRRGVLVKLWDKMIKSRTKR